MAAFLRCTSRDREDARRPAGLSARHSLSPLLDLSRADREMRAARPKAHFRWEPGEGDACASPDWVCTASASRWRGMARNNIQFVEGRPRQGATIPDPRPE